MLRPQHYRVAVTLAFVHIVSPGRQPLQLTISAPLDIGREGDGLLLADDRISRRHCRVEPDGEGAIRITDLGSANGVIVNGHRIVEPTVVPPGSHAFIGDTRIEVLTGQSVPAPYRTTLATGISNPTRSSAIERVALAVSDLRAPGLVDVSDEPGTLTIAFSDIEESTEHALQVGDTKWAQIMDHHNALIARHVDARQGRIVRNLGDGFMMSFRSARQGLLAAIDMQRHLAKVADRNTEFGLKVRMGLHTGEVLQNDEGDLFGRHVQLAAKIGDAAAGGQILVSSLVKAITEPRGDLIFGQEMAVEVEGVPVSQSVFDVDWRHSAVDAGSPTD